MIYGSRQKLDLCMTRREAKFDTGTRLQFERSPDSEIHYITDAPRFIKVGISAKF
jgi:hypothetical protein